MSSGCRLLALAAVVGIAGGCAIDRAGLGSADASTPPGLDGGGPVDAGPPECRAGTVDVNGDPADGCECVLSTPPEELCNGGDDDCDGMVDEVTPMTCGGAPGSCGAGTLQCTRGAWETVCLPDVAPTEEICDGADNNCDGTVDEGCDCTIGSMRECGTDVGSCAFGVQTCTVDGTWGACEGATGPVAEACDGADNDCDGTVDSMSRPCGTATGACRRGSQVCIGGSWGACAGGVTPGTEICDAARADEDCDGMDNEGCLCSEGDTRTCGSGSCRGSQRCDVTGSWGRCVAASIGTEVCNGEDDDCNGTIDDGSGDCASDSGCAVRRRGTSVYLLCHASTISWSSASGACAALGYHLVVINDMGENDFLQTQTSTVSAGDWWIGLSDLDGDGMYESDEWDGGRSTYENWNDSNPDHSGQCAMFVNSDSGLWDDKSCGGNKQYICEAEP